MEPSPPVLEMKGIIKEFPGVRALRGVDFTVRRGEIHALLGENGAGKSTLMKILCGVYPAGSYQGQVHLTGRQVRFLSPHDAHCQGIGYVPQEIAVLDHCTVAENIFIGQWNGPGRAMVRMRSLIDQARALLKRCRIDLDPCLPAGLLNPSQRQLVMISRALARNPAVLVLDEATACLTQDETRNLFSVIRHLREQGCTCITITHKLAEVAELADRATVLRDGSLAASFDRADFDENALVAAMIGRRIEQVFPSRPTYQGGKELLAVENLTIPHPQLAGRKLVEDVSFTVRAGEILGLGGLVGAGRSEVLRAIYGQLSCTGRIRVASLPVVIRSPAQAMRHGIGFLTEERKRDGLLFNCAIRENASLHHLRAIASGLLLNQHRERRVAEDFRVQLGIRAASVDVMVRTLSGGNQQKVVLAKTLFAQPKILLLDEPTKGIDVGAKAEIYALIDRLAAQGLAIVLVSSELPELLALADNHVVLARGKVRDRFTRAEAGEHRFMRAATGLSTH